MLAKVLWTLGVWAFCGLAAIFVIADTMLGPTIHDFDGAHGVHLGDVIALVAAPAYASWLTWAFWRRPGRAADRRPVDHSSR